MENHEIFLQCDKLFSSNLSHSAQVRFGQLEWYNVKYFFVQVDKNIFLVQYQPDIFVHIIKFINSNPQNQIPPFMGIKLSS